MGLLTPSQNFLKVFFPWVHTAKIPDTPMYTDTRPRPLLSRYAAVFAVWILKMTATVWDQGRIFCLVLFVLGGLNPSLIWCMDSTLWGRILGVSSSHAHSVCVKIYIEYLGLLVCIPFISRWKYVQSHNIKFDENNWHNFGNELPYMLCAWVPSCHIWAHC